MMFENQKEIVSQSKFGLIFTTQEVMAIVGGFGLLYYLRIFVNGNLHWLYYISYILLAVYLVIPVPKTKNKKVYNIYLTYCYRILEKWRNEK